ncbi:spore photoproduct lyase family protein [Jannaschia sp. LMIT008]|uniref:spore photoproduct lyase family protein n=1 Tax=Jannaschia maritima TaxID=3032585 RepID=UPI0028124EB4|nr:radical SAM protein [Jannaschia sp. LMIT008]
MDLSPHLDPRTDPGRADPQPDAPVNRRARFWRPRRVVILKAAAGSPVAERAARVGAELGAEVVHAARLTGLKGGDERQTYRSAKSTLAITTAPPSSLRLQPIPPSADFRLDLATGCPAHCQYCYLAGSLTGPPVTRAFSNLNAIWQAALDHRGQGTITSATDARADEGTTFEASCYTDPLAIEHLTGGLATLIERFGTQGDMGLRFTTKYDHVDDLLDLPHNGRTRMRASVNADIVARRWEGGTAPVAARLSALGRMAAAGYPVGLTVAPIMPVEDWEEAYAALFAQAAAALPDGADLTVELITHRFTPGSKEILTGWYPATTLEMDEAVRVRKFGKFGNVKYVYPAALMRDMRTTLEGLIDAHLSGARVLYWT